MTEMTAGKKASRRKKSHRLYAGVTLFLMVLAFVLCFMIFFYTEGFTVEGNDYCSKQEIYDTVLENPYEVNTLYVLAKYKLGFGKKLACMDKMKVGLNSPWSLKVTVEEKPIMGYVKNKDQYVYFDKEGLVVDISTEAREGLPSIDGVNFKKIELYKKLKSSKTKIFNQILETTQEVKKYELTPDKLVYEKNSLNLYFGDICVSLGSSVSSDQMAQIEPILAKLTDQKGTLHLENYSTAAKVITFEKKKEETEESKDSTSSDADTSDSSDAGTAWDYSDTWGTGQDSSGSDSTQVYTWDGSNMNLYDGSGWYDTEGNYYDSGTSDATGSAGSYGY